MKPSGLLVVSLEQVVAPCPSPHPPFPETLTARRVPELDEHGPSLRREFA